ncbi:hypothetical protein A1O1_03730 [Capronia coronata CBS 617.96]|uniref:Uncharacterized protein n=1 Tax=Capronia coronata CBS 617.96 TaxID=1182541 RepID=W9YCL6_9EURO|nr:uncharacterized protein A1O1_03730 [Capronia coronata CBS 617.96]EXJ90627.1 hypothetical protein A1O1_03730 [Capronia coronata CBS 617.96]
MSSRPSSSHRMRMTSPPPSRALLNLQKQGLELGLSPSRNTQQVTRSHASPSPTPSDRDKPLPLEPFEKRRSSSVYSTDTTISNIIYMYGGYQELDDSPPVTALHHPQAYRDTVVPLLIKRLSIGPSSSPQAIQILDARETVSSISLNSATLQTSTPTLGNKAAPSFLEFSRALQDRRNELLSPSSSAPSDYHRQAAYDQLAPPSPQISSVEQSISVSQTPPLPDAMSGTISDIDDSDLLPPPLRLGCSSPPSPLVNDWESSSSMHCPSSIADQSQEQISHPAVGGSWSENWLHVDFVNHGPISEPSRHDARSSSKIGDPLTEKEQERILSYAEAKYPGMRKSSYDMIRSQRSSTRSSFQQGVSNLLRTLSHSNRADGKQGNNQEAPPRERQLAVPATPYQVYGAEIWSKKIKKKQREAQRDHERGKPLDLLSAYQSGQSQFVGVLEGAKRKLGRKTSQKRRRKLKQSIIFVGPPAAQASANALERSAQDNDTPWI